MQLSSECVWQLACLRKIGELKRKIGRMKGKIGERCENKRKEK